MQCPHCLTHFHPNWSYADALIVDTSGVWAAAMTTCPACNNATITLGHTQRHPQGATIRLNDYRTVHPKSIARVALPNEVPPEFSADYKEACLVLSDSPKASAALSRRCLQHILREKAGIKKGDLSNEIQQVLDSKQLSTNLAENLDAIRHIGNFAAHPNKSTNTAEIVDVEPHEAEWMLDVLEHLFDFYFVQPERAKAKRDALNAKLKAAGKPPMKQA